MIVALSFAIGSVLGVISWYFWVIGLFALGVGLGLGFGVGVLGGWLGLGRGALVGFVVVGVLVSRGAFEVREEMHQERLFARDLAALRAAESGLSPQEIERVGAAGGDAFWAGGGAGRSGLPEAWWERWWARAEGGVRLAGSASASRGVPVGPWGALVWDLVELGLAGALALRIAGRSVAGARAER